MMVACATTDPRAENPSTIKLVNKDKGVSYGFQIAQKYLQRGVYKAPYVNYVFDSAAEQSEYDRQLLNRKLNAESFHERMLSYKGTLSGTYSNQFRNNWQIQITYWDTKTPEQKTYVTVPALQFVILTLEIENGKMSVSEAIRTMSGKPVEIIIAESSVLPDSVSSVAKNPWEWSVFTDAANGGTSVISMSDVGAALTFYGRVAPYTKNNNAGFVGWTITPDVAALVRLKTATAISFKVRGDGQTYRIQLPTSDITDSRYYETTFTTNRISETTVIVNISDFAQPGGSGRAINKSNIQNIQVMTAEGMRGGFRLTISDLTLIQ
jgi:hypothetical protein